MSPYLKSWGFFSPKFYFTYGCYDVVEVVEHPLPAVLDLDAVVVEVEDGVVPTLAAAAVAAAVAVPAWVRGEALLEAEVHLAAGRQAVQVVAEG